MIVDASALLAILLKEDGHDVFVDALGDRPPAAIGAPTRFEFLMACYGKGGSALKDDGIDLLERAFVETVAWTGQMADIALDAFVRYGRGGHHPARLNFGDCMSYAVAKALDRPLLFKGDDFARSDITSAL